MELPKTLLKTLFPNKELYAEVRRTKDVLEAEATAADSQCYKKGDSAACFNIYIQLYNQCKKKGDSAACIEQHM